MTNRWWWRAGCLVVAGLCLGCGSHKRTVSTSTDESALGSVVADERMQAAPVTESPVAIESLLIEQGPAAPEAAPEASQPMAQAATSLETPAPAAQDPAAQPEASASATPVPEAPQDQAAVSQQPQAGVEPVAQVLEPAPVVASAAPVVSGPPGSDGYAVQPEDVLQITVYQEPDLTTRARVASSGEIIVPLLGRVQVAGLPVAQVQQRLTDLFGADYLVNPQVQVFVESYHARLVFVTGAVNRPGSYPIPIEKETTVMEAVAMAGGFSEGASMNATRIIRNEHGVKQTIEVRASDILKKGDRSKDVAVLPNDIIVVPESFF